MPRDDKRPKSRYWMLTGFEEEPSFDQFTMNAMRVGREICPTTKKEHYHACIQFVSEIRVTTLKQIFPKANLEMKKGNKAEFFAYSKKDGDFTDHGIAEHGNQGERNDFAELIEAVDEGDSFPTLMLKFPKVVARHMPYARELITNRNYRVAMEKRKHRFSGKPKHWQQCFIDLIGAPPGDRLIHWIYDGIGGSGKSYLCGHLQVSHGAFITTGGKVADIAHAYNSERIVIFDLPRTMAEHCDHIYSMIECFKNGALFSGKYQSALKIFDVPHVLVFANFMPDQSKLSKDRWDISDINDEAHWKYGALDEEEERYDGSEDI